MIETEHGRRIAILIGTNEYSKMEKLEFAESDAREMAKILLDPDICGFDEVIELIDENKENVSKTIEKVFKNTKKDDQVLIYYSGHGKPSYKFDLCLLFKDTDPESLLATSLKFDYINECKEQSACKRLVVILDCCYSGTAGMRGNYLDEILSSYSGSGTILLTSTGETGSNIAKEDRDLKHGIFTYYLLKGLKDWAADDDDDGIITVDDLYKYTFNQTKDKGLQRPQMKGSYEGEMVLGRNLQKIRDREFEQKKEKLIQYLSSFPPVLYKSFTIFQKMYNKPSALDPFEVKIKPHLESLLNDEIQVEAYVDIVKYQEKLQKQQEVEQRQKERLEREKKEREEQEKLRKQRDEEIQRQRKEEERKKEQELLERQQLKEQERKRREEEKSRREREKQEKKQLEEQEKKHIEEEVKAKREKEEQERKYGEETESQKLEASKTQTFFSSMKKLDRFSGKNMFLISIFLGTILIWVAAPKYISLRLYTFFQTILGTILIWISATLYYLKTNISVKKALTIGIFLGTFCIWIPFIYVDVLTQSLFFGSLLIWVSAVLYYLEIVTLKKKALVLGIFVGTVLICISAYTDVFWRLDGFDYVNIVILIILGNILIWSSALLQYLKIDISKKKALTFCFCLGVFLIWISFLQGYLWYGESFWGYMGTTKIYFFLGTFLILISAILQYSKA